ncbi:hypothetical protein PG993_010466 [Apiospora rasikravindrae]|uniref:Uncharacterized protein n=1 Tax=Apiospora rasikravindrae TaxID=990691 RepID=A0ABR1SME3_9PEZI
MAAPSGYTPEFPSTFPPTDKLRDFIPSFFQLSDDATKNEEWVGYFYPDATVIMGEDEAQGTESEYLRRESSYNRAVGIRRRLCPMAIAHELTSPRCQGFVNFEAGSSREPDEEGERNFMLKGEVEYRLKTGETKAARWTAYAKVKEDHDRIRFAYYKVEIQA